MEGGGTVEVAATNSTAFSTVSGCSARPRERFMGAGCVSLASSLLSSSEILASFGRLRSVRPRPFFGCKERAGVLIVLRMMPEGLPPILLRLCRRSECA